MGTIAIAVLTEKRRENSEGLWVIFGECSDIVEDDILTMQRFLDVSRFLYSGGWLVCMCICTISPVNRCTPSSPDCSRLVPLTLDYTRLTRPKPKREPLRRLALYCARVEIIIRIKFA